MTRLTPEDEKEMREDDASYLKPANLALDRRKLFREIDALRAEIERLKTPEGKADYFHAWQAEKADHAKTLDAAEKAADMIEELRNAVIVATAQIATFRNACTSGLQAIKAICHTLEYVNPADATIVIDAWKELEDALK